MDRRVFWVVVRMLGCSVRLLECSGWLQGYCKLGSCMF